MGITEMTKLWKQLGRIPFELQRYPVQNFQRLADFLSFQPCCLGSLGEESSGTSLFFRDETVLETRWLERKSCSMELLKICKILDLWRHYLWKICCFFPECQECICCRIYPGTIRHSAFTEGHSTSPSVAGVLEQWRLHHLCWDNTEWKIQLRAIMVTR